MPKTRFRCALLLAALASCAQAHDTWFEPLAGGGATELALGTGAKYPKRESGIDPVYLRRQGCRQDETTAPTPLTALRQADDALIVAAAPGATTCWAQLTPFEIELPEDKVAVYLDEVRPPQAVLDAWAELRSRGVPWRERYTKHARIELSAPAAAQAVPIDFDIVPEGGSNPARVGSVMGLQVLRDGEPLPGQAVELRSDRTPSGFWRRTDADGRIRFAPPLPGRWIARAVDLRLSADPPDSWDSRFVTLAFEVLPRTAAP